MTTLTLKKPALQNPPWLGARTNPSECFNTLFREYWSPLVNYAARYLPDQAEREDVLQEVFVELYTKREKIDIKVSVSSYLYSFTRNRILNYIRNQKTYRKYLAMAAAQRIQTNNHTEATVDFLNACDRIAALLASMPCKYRQVYILCREYQLTVARTAQILQRPVGTVEKQLKKAINILRAGLTEVS
jgi:RNA polymerase sigma-70 factor (family 1)